MANNRIKATVLWAALFSTALAPAPAGAAGKPGPVVVPAPALLYINKSGAIEVSNADGSAAAVVVPAGDIHRPNWSPASMNTMVKTDPARIVFERGICNLHEIDVWVENNVVKSSVLENPATGERDLPQADASIQDSACAADMYGAMLVSGEGHTETPTSDLFTMTRGADGSWSVPQQVYGVPYNSATSRATITWSTFSRDGNSIAFVESDDIGRIKIRDGGSGVVSTVLENSAYDPTLLEWSPTEDTLAFGAKGNLYVMTLNFDSSTGAWSRGSLTNIASAAGGSPTWSADGKKIYFVNSNGLSTISKSASGTWGAVTLLNRFASRPRYRN